MLRLLVGLTTLIGLAGCGGTTSPGATPTPTPSAPASPGVAFTADAFHLLIPAGWTDKTQDPVTYAQVVQTDQGIGVLVLIHPPPGVVQSGVNDVQGNIVVLQLNTMVPDTELETFAGQKRAGVSGLTPPQRTTVGGSVAYTIQYNQNVNSTPGGSEEAYVNHDGRTYVISLTTSAFAFNDQEHDLTSLLNSWKWKT